MGAFVWVLLCCTPVLFAHLTVRCSAEPVFQQTFAGQDDDKGISGVDDSVFGSGNLVEEERGKKKGMMKMLMLIKMIAVTVLLPKIIGLALFASWKGITLSLIAFTVAVFSAVRAAASAAATPPAAQPAVAAPAPAPATPGCCGGDKGVQHIYLKTDNGGSNDHHHHEHWWRRIRDTLQHHGDNHNSFDPYHGWDK